MDKFVIHSTFGKHLRMLRENVNLTLKEVALEVDIDLSLLAKIERDERHPTRFQIKKLSLFFKVNEKELLETFLSDQIAYKILDEDVDLSILRVAEEKVEYIKQLKKN